MDGAIIFLIVFLMLAMVGGAVYFFWYRKYSCNKKGADTSSNVATWLWSSDDSKCYANTCTSGYSTDGSSFICTKAKTATLKSISSSNACTISTGSTATINKDGKDDPTCSAACTKGDGTCMGYSWDSSSTGGCSIITVAAPTAADTTKPGSCQSATWA